MCVHCGACVCNVQRVTSNTLSNQNDECFLQTHRVVTAPKKQASRKSDQAVLVGECTLHNGTDYRGKTSKDIKYITAKSVQECCRVCGENARCLHFSFDEVSDVCYLKEATGKVVTQVEGLISGDLQFLTPGVSLVTS